MAEGDFFLEQDYFNRKRWLINRMVHGWDVVCGLDVQLKEGTTDRVLVSPGLALDLIRCLPLVRYNYISSWLILRPIFDPEHQTDDHTYTPETDHGHPWAEKIILFLIDRHSDQLSPLAITQDINNAPAHGESIHYGGERMGETIFQERAYT